MFLSAVSRIQFCVAHVPWIEGCKQFVRCWLNRLFWEMLRSWAVMSAPKMSILLYRRTPTQLQEFTIPEGKSAITDGELQQKSTSKAGSVVDRRVSFRLYFVFPCINYNLKHYVIQHMAEPSATPTPPPLKTPRQWRRERRPLPERATYFPPATFGSFVSHNKLHNPSCFPTGATFHPLMGCLLLSCVSLDRKVPSSSTVLLRGALPYSVLCNS